MLVINLVDKLADRGRRFVQAGVLVTIVRHEIKGVAAVG